MEHNTPFELDERLSGSTIDFGTIAPNLNLRLVNDSRWPWLMLVPEVPGAIELDDLSPPALSDLFRSAAVLAEALRTITGAPKTNIGALGNLVPQFHFHIIARNPADPAWPDGVWGHKSPVPYETDQIEQLRTALFGRLSGEKPEEARPVEASDEPGEAAEGLGLSGGGLGL